MVKCIQCGKEMDRGYISTIEGFYCRDCWNKKMEPEARKNALVDEIIGDLIIKKFNIDLTPFKSRMDSIGLSESELKQRLARRIRDLLGI